MKVHPIKILSSEIRESECSFVAGIPRISGSLACKSLNGTKFKLVFNDLNDVNELKKIIQLVLILQKSILRVLLEIHLELILRMIDIGLLEEVWGV